MLWTVGVVLAATLLGLMLERGMGVSRGTLLYFGAVLICAGWLGVWYGLLAALAATLAYNLSTGAATLHFVLGTKQDIVNLVVYSVGAWIAGLYVDETRRERDAVLSVARRPRHVASESRLVRLRDWLRGWPPLVEASRVAVALLVSISSLGIGLLVMRAVGPAAVSMIYLAGVVLSASLLGSRYALITALVNVVAYDYFVVEPRYTLALNSAVAGVNLVVFLAVGWQVGRFTERVRYERRAVRSLFDAGRSFSATADEQSLRELICKAVAMVSGSRYVAVCDETGRVFARTAAREHDPPPPELLRETSPIPPHRLWSVQALSAEGRTFGRVIWARGVPDEDRLVEATVNVLVDLGGAAISRARLSAEHAQLEVVAQAEQLRRALLASVSHDLRTPLAGILGSATSLLDHFDKYDERIRRDLLANIREQAHRLSRYIENLLGMTRLESGTLQPQLQAVALEAVVVEAWEIIAENAGPTKPELDIEDGLEVLADPTLLRQVLWNLLENAVKFSPSGSTVEVSGRLIRNRVRLTIRDEGPGLPEGEAEQLFEPFVRGLHTKGSGFGLGLFIARSFLEAMGAAIKARAAKDGRTGLTFELSLPRPAIVEVAA
ncbi:MAG TPA: DUF4118 domain-containing protein [Phenylobacterium sp.]|uniref:DUF4118 domain-containing protein n=1 Tax=Phenylobacterium sp. TaxID=1871053 RepID=UPI002B7A1E05|nr:DUF4118 domain-containing protein [Phenylobacterium sp.]HSV03856.1 DUF4118 domain-containing protein [Phenylobacterium sp.]